MSELDFYHKDNVEWTLSRPYTPWFRPKDGKLENDLSPVDPWEE